LAAASRTSPAITDQQLAISCGKSMMMPARNALAWWFGVVSTILVGCSVNVGVGGAPDAAPDHAIVHPGTDGGAGCGYTGESCRQGTVCNGELLCEDDVCVSSGSGSGSGSGPRSGADAGSSAADSGQLTDASVNPDAAPPACTTIPGTSTAVGAACITKSSFPALQSPVDPLTYGADSAGSDDSSAAFQSAINASDVYFGHPGTYLINTSVFPPSNRNIQCAPGVTLLTTNHDASDTGIIVYYATTGGSVAGCDFRGTNTDVPTPLDENQGNFLIEITDAEGVMIEGNTFEATWADAAISLNTGTTGPGGSSSTIQFNTFSGNPLYGPVVTSGTYDVLNNNLLIDTSIGVEANDGEAVGHITIKNNQVTYVHGQCGRAGSDGCPGSVYIAGGNYVDGFSGSSYSLYGTNLVTANYCSGSDGTENAEIDDATDSYDLPPPSYTGDVLGPGCICDSGSSSC
jgi:hypothetical protein